MNFCVRPSKSFIFDFLEKKIKNIKGEVGLDAASAAFKNRQMFKTDKYFGLDIDLPALKKAILKNKLPNTFGLWADLNRLEKIPSNSVDLLVSTNTLYVFKEKRLEVIGDLTRITAPEGEFLFQIPIDGYFEETKKFITDNFQNAEIVYFRNIFSRLYEGIFENEGYLGSHPIAGSKPFRLLGWCISRLEYLTNHFKWLNSEAFIVCKNKKVTAKKEYFDLSNYSLIDKDVYSIKN